MRTGTRILSATLGALAFAGPASAAWAQLAPTVTVSPATAMVGDMVEVSGSMAPGACADPLGNVVLTLAGGPDLGRVAASLDGAFALTAAVPEMAEGEHTVQATCEAAGIVPVPVSLATTTLTVIAGPTAPAPPATPEPLPVTAEPSEVAAEPAPEPVAAPRIDEATTPAPQPTPTQAPLAEGPIPSQLPRTDADAEPPVAVDEGPRASVDDDPIVAAPTRWEPAGELGSLWEPTITSAGASAAAMSLMIFSLLIGFPAAIFNGTLRNHYDDILLTFHRRMPKTAGLRDRMHAHLPSAPLGAMVFFGAVTSAALDPSLGANIRSAAIFVAMAVTVGVGGWLGWLPTKRTSDRYGNDGHYRSYPMGLVVAIACVLLTRLGGLHPGYLYGLLFAYEVRGHWTPADDGRTFAHGYLAVFALSLAAWAAMPLTSAAAAEPTASAAMVGLDAMLAGMTLMGINGIVFGMFPVQFAPGKAIWSWRKSVWLSTWAAGVLALVVLLSTPNRNLLSVEADPASAKGAGIAFVAFCLVSFSFWEAMRRRARRQARLAPQVAPDDAAHSLAEVPFP